MNSTEFLLGGTRLFHLKKNCILFFVTLLTLFIMGCSTPISEMPISDFDDLSASNEFNDRIDEKIKKIMESKTRIAFLSSKNIDSLKNEYKYLNDYFLLSICNLSFMRVVPIDKKISEIIEVNVLTSNHGGKDNELKLGTVDKVIFYEIKNIYFKEYGLFEQFELQKREKKTSYQGQNSTYQYHPIEYENPGQYIVEIGISIRDVKTNMPMDFWVQGKSKPCFKDDVNTKENMIKVAMKDAVHRLIDDLTIMFSPPGRVLLTKDSGKVALINQGRKFGVRVGTEVSFFLYVANGDDLVENPVATGVVIDKDQSYISDTTAWVRVDQSKIVKKNMLFRLHGIRK